VSITRRAATLGGLSLVAGTSVSTVSRAELGSFLGIEEGIEDFILATDAYIYGYPLVTMEMTRRVVTNVAAPVGTRGPMGQIIKLRQYPDASFRDVTAPNADTLYTTAFFDVGKEPWVLSIPDMNGRYALLPMLDGWTTVFQVPGKRTTGTSAQTYAITGPGWKGTLPAGVKEYKSPTSLVWLLGRIYCTGTPEDYAEVHKLQDEFKLVPFSSYGKPYTPPAGTVDPSIDMKTAVREQVNRMDAVAYFTLLCKLMKDNPPTAADAPQLAKFAGDWHRSRSGLRCDQAQGGFRQARARGRIRPDLAPVQDQQGRQGRERLGLYDQDRHLRYRLSDAGARHRYRARCQPAAGCGLSDLAEGRRRPEIQW
jgi:hypothetical protein